MRWLLLVLALLAAPGYALAAPENIPAAVCDLLLADEAGPTTPFGEDGRWRTGRTGGVSVPSVGIGPGQGAPAVPGVTIDGVTVVTPPDNDPDLDESPTLSGPLVLDLGAFAPLFAGSKFLAGELAVKGDAAFLDGQPLNDAARDLLKRLCRAQREGTSAPPPPGLE